MVGVVGEAIQHAPRAAGMDVKRRYEHVLILFQPTEETAVTDHQLIQEPVTLDHVQVSMLY